MKKILLLTALLLPAAWAISSPELVSQEIKLKNGKDFKLQVLKGYEIIPAFEGMERLRFMAMSPDGRLFATQMHSLDDNQLGKISIFEGFNPVTAKFSQVTDYLSKLRNPNNIAFYTDNANKTWLYVSYTDQLLRYPYKAGDLAPSGPGQVLASFPAYGLSYKYGGWHLTRTVEFHGDKLYVAVGSSCDSCEEKADEPARASILEMNPDGSDSQPYIKGLRNAVRIKWIQDKFFATNMGSDHLGPDAPQDTFLQLQEGANYGWPYCYAQGGKIMDDTSKAWAHKSVKASDVPLPWAELGAHVAPLGFEYFGDSADEPLKDSFLIALHGSSKPSLKRGYMIARLRHKAGQPEAVISGFLQDGQRVARCCDILKDSDQSFFFSDDFGGVLYYVRKLAK